MEVVFIYDNNNDKYNYSPTVIMQLLNDIGILRTFPIFKFIVDNLWGPGRD